MSAVNVDLLAAAIYEVSVRHNWATTTDTEDRTEEIAAEYELLGCLRCAEMRRQAPEAFVLLVNPTVDRSPEWEHEEGERIRVMALELHASAGHPQ